MELRILDLFSGIGGFSYALTSIGKTVAYCEVDNDCKIVINSNIKKGYLSDAVIFDNVETLHGCDVESLKPNIITAGFPCTDISIANIHGKGLKGNKSGLFKHIIRLIDEIPSIDYVFLENSYMIKRRGLTTIKKEFTKRGFSMRWCVFSASDIGALHRRKRWYCLCYKNSTLEHLNQIDEKYIVFKWKATPMNRVIKYESKHKRRCKLLGNSVVPQCLMIAWNMLLENAKKTKTLQREVYIQPAHSAIDLGLVMTDGLKMFTKKLWATPTYHTWCIFSRITGSRCRTLLPMQLYYERNTKVPGDKTKLNKEYTCNPRFVEHLMGYPKDWTHGLL